VTSGTATRPVDHPGRGATPGAGPGRRVDPGLRHRLAERGVDRQLLLLLPGIVFVVGLFIYPFLYGLGLSFQPTKGGAPLADYQRFFGDEFQRDTIWKTLRLALPAALLNVLASVPIAYRMRGRFRGKRLITTLLVVPITLGTVLTAEGLLNFLGPAGWFNRILISAGVVGEPVRLINNYWGVFFSLVITGFPFAFLVGNPQGETRVISIAAYQAAYEQYDYPFASAIAMIMGVVELLVLGLVLLWRSRLYTGSTGGKG